MLKKTLLGHVRPFFDGFVYKDAKLTKSYDKFEWPEERIVFEVLTRKNSRAYGSGCGVKTPGYDTLPVRLYDLLTPVGALIARAAGLRQK